MILEGIDFSYILNDIDPEHLSIIREAMIRDSIFWIAVGLLLFFAGLLMSYIAREHFSNIGKFDREDPSLYRYRRVYRDSFDVDMPLTLSHAATVLGFFGFMWGIISLTYVYQYGEGAVVIYILRHLKI